MPRGIPNDPKQARVRRRRTMAAKDLRITERPVHGNPVHDVLVERAATQDAAPTNVIGKIEAAVCAFNEINHDSELTLGDARLFVRLLLAMKP